MKYVKTDGFKNIYILTLNLSAPTIIAGICLMTRQSKKMMKTCLMKTEMWTQKASLLTYLSVMDLLTFISRTAPFAVLGVLGGIIHFSTKL